MGIRRLDDVVGLAPIASFIDSYSTVEQALGETGLTAQMILHRQARHPSYRSSRCLMALDAAEAAHQGLDTGGNMGPVPWARISRPPPRDLEEGDDDDADLDELLKRTKEKN